MKKWFVLLFVVGILARCSTPENCFKSRGETVVRTFDVSQNHFSKIEVNPGIALVIKQGANYEVKVESGKNIIDDIRVEVIADKLILKEDSGCNFNRSYNGTTVYVTAPFLDNIYSNSDQPVRSDGLLTYPILRLISMDFFGGVGSGDFDISVANYQVVIESNHVSTFRISGQTQELLASIYNGNGRIEAAQLISKDVTVFHRGSNDMVLHPQEILRGNLYSTGNLIYVNEPSVELNVNQYYHGRIIYAP